MGKESLCASRCHRRAGTLFSPASLGRPRLPRHGLTSAFTVARAMPLQRRTTSRKVAGDRHTLGWSVDALVQEAHRLAAGVGPGATLQVHSRDGHLALPPSHRNPHVALPTIALRGLRAKGRTPSTAHLESSGRSLVAHCAGRGNGAAFRAGGGSRTPKPPWHLSTTGFDRSCEQCMATSVALMA